MAVKKYLSLVPLAAVMLACLPPSALAAGPVTVTSIEPSSGPASGGTSVTIRGTGFVSGATVKIGSDATKVNVASEVEITATTPIGSGAQEVVVEDANGTSSGGPKYIYIAPATVASITPNQGPISGGTSVKINGTGFLSGATVNIGSAATEVNVVSEEEITATTPVGSGAQEVVVADANGTSSGGPTYTYIAPPAVVTKPASSLTQTSATLNATVNPNGGKVSECEFEYGTTTAYGLTAACSAPGEQLVAVSASVTGLSANTTYHFRIVARTAGGTSGGGDLEFKTAAEPLPPGQPPSPPPPIVQVKPVVIPNSSFKVMGASLSLATYAITFVESVVDPGTFTWVMTFENGKFGVFAARVKKCRSGSIRLKGKCRPARVLFARGRQTVATAGSVTFTVRPTRAGVKALKKAFKKNKGLPVVATVTYQSLRGGKPISRVQSLIVKGRR